MNGNTERAYAALSRVLDLQSELSSSKGMKEEKQLIMLWQVKMVG